MRATESTEILYFDGLCPLCSREMRSLGKRKSSSLELVDIHSVKHLDAIQRKALLRRLHLRLPDGRWLIGVDASVRAWSHTRWGWLLKPLTWPVLGLLVRFVYHRWADRRYRSRYGCEPCGGSEQ